MKMLVKLNEQNTSNISQVQYQQNYTSIEECIDNTPDNQEPENKSQEYKPLGRNLREMFWGG